MPAKSSPRATPRCVAIPARALPQRSLWPPGSVALALSVGSSRFPSPSLALPPGVERASPSPPPNGASARPGLLAASRRLPEHAPPIYRQGPPPTAISVSCQLPAAHSGRRSREPGPELSPRAGREHREPACLPSSPSCPECSARPHSWELWRGLWSDAPLEGRWACSSGAPGSSCRQECPGRMKHLPIALVPAAVA